MSDDDSVRPETTARAGRAASPRAGTAVQDGADPDVESAKSATTANLPAVGGPGDPYADPYVDRNGRATRGSTATPGVGPRSGTATPAEAATGPTPVAKSAPPAAAPPAAAPPAAPPSSGPGSSLPPTSMPPVAPPSPSARPAPTSAVDQYAALGLGGGPAVPGAAPAPPSTSSAAVPGAAVPPATPVPTSTARRPRAQRTPRRARLQLRHFNVWTVFKFSVVLAVALFFVWLIIVAVLYGTLDHLQAINKVNDTVRTIENDSSTNDAVTPRIVFTAAFLIGLVNIVLFIALTTIGSVVYNLCADLVGGIEVTLAERD